MPRPSFRVRGPPFLEDFRPPGLILLAFLGSGDAFHRIHCSCSILVAVENVLQDSSNAEFLIRLKKKPDANNQQPGTFDLDNSNLAGRFFPLCSGSNQPAVTKIFDECSRHSYMQWLMAEEIIYLMKVLKQNLQYIGIHRPRCCVEIPAKYRVIVPLSASSFAVRYRFSHTMHFGPPLSPIRSSLVAISVVFQALTGQCFLFQESTVQSMVKSIPLCQIVKDSSQRVDDVQILWNPFDSESWISCSERGNHGLVFHCNAMDIALNEVTLTGVNWYQKILIGQYQ